MNKKYGLEVNESVWEIKDMMGECPFEGSELAYLADIRESDEHEGEFEIDIISDGEGYTYTTLDAKEMGLDVRVVVLD